MLRRNSGGRSVSQAVAYSLHSGYHSPLGCGIIHVGLQGGDIFGDNTTPSDMIVTGGVGKES